MEPIQKEIDIGKLDMLLRFWKNRGIKSPYHSKLELLLFGRSLKPLMDSDGRYPRMNFGHLISILGFRTISELVTTVKKSCVFVLIGESDFDAEYICSPFWNTYAHNTCNFDAILQMGSSISIEEENNKKINSPKRKEEEKKNSPLKNLPEVLPENLAIAEEFFRYINSSPSLYDEFYTTFIEEFKEKKFTQEESERITGYMMNDTLKPYFARKPQFLRESNDARVERFRALLQKTRNTWLRSIKGAAMHKLIEENKLKQREQHYADTESELWY